MKFRQACFKFLRSYIIDFYLFFYSRAVTINFTCGQIREKINIIYTYNWYDYQFIYLYERKKEKKNVKRSCIRTNKFSNLMLDIYTYIIWLLIRKTYFHLISTHNQIINEV